MTLGYTLFSLLLNRDFVEAGTNLIIESKSATAMWSHTGKATVLLTAGASAEPAIAALPITGELATSYPGPTRALSIIFRFGFYVSQDFARQSRRLWCAYVLPCLQLSYV